jgi:lipopolysaccharide export system permease protein
LSKFDRYLLAQLLALFGFFSLVLVAVYWVNRAVKLFDQLIGDGQSALVFLEFSILTLPNVIRLVLPISAFAACVYAINRLMQESELVVMQATGFSAFRLARPVFFFGVAVLAMQLVLTNVLVPLSQSRLSDRSAEIRENVTARFLNEGRFMHPSDGITLYIREITPLGELNDLFLSDERDPEDRLVYTAERALLVRGEKGPQLVMLDGVTQRLVQADRRIALTRFETFTLDLSEVVKARGGMNLSVNELSTPELLMASEATQQATGATRAELLEEGHSRFASSLLSLAAPLLGFAALMLGGFSRFGMMRQIGLAVGLLIVLQSLSTMATSTAVRNEGAFALVYLPPLLGMAVAAWLLWLAQRPRRLRRQAERAA